MVKIKAQTEKWGGENVVHLEIDWNGKQLGITVDDAKIVIHTITPIRAKKQTAMNYIEIVREK